jgi:hypothetical protein
MSLSSVWACKCLIKGNGTTGGKGDLWDVAPCCLVDAPEALAASIIRAMGDLLYHTTRRNIPEDSHLHTKLFACRKSRT